MIEQVWQLANNGSRLVWIEAGDSDEDDEHMADGDESE